MSRFRRATPVREVAVDGRCFDLLSLGLGFVLAVHAPHLPWWLAATLALLLGWRWWQRRHRLGRVPRWIKLPLLVALTGAVVLAYGTIFGRQPGSALAVGLLVLKLLETESARDVRVGASFACFALMAALLFNQGLVATFAVALGLIPLLATLRALEPGQPAARPLPRSLVPAALQLLVALPLALVAFVLVPRLDTPLWGVSSPDEGRSGLSDSMTPGNFTDLLLDDSPAMRVSFEGTPPPPAERYFRGYVMWNFDGRSWSYANPRHASPAHPAPIKVLRRARYHIALEPMHNRLLPMLDVPLTAPGQATLRTDREVIAQRPVTTRREYTGESALAYRFQPELDARSRMLGLRLPEGFNPRTRVLAERWRQQYGNDAAAIVKAGLDLIRREGFRYTLAPAPLGRDSVDDFLFDTREGFCEHYASAYTVLMRAAGLPARVVTGYQGGFWNQFGRYLLVRNSDAHAWSEVWLEGRGWVRVDPTAAISPERVSLGAAAAAGDQLAWYRAGWLQQLRDRWDVTNRWWNQAVVGFNALRQRGLLTPFGIRDADASVLGIALALVTLLFMAAGLAWTLGRRDARDPLLMAIRRLERKLARAGVARRPGEGPRHFLTRAMHALPGNHRELAALRTAWIELRYRQDLPSAESVQAFRRAVRDFLPGDVVK